MSLKRRINTIQNTSKITKAMSLVAAGQTNKIKLTLGNYHGYYDLLAKIMSHLAYTARSRFDEAGDFITIDREITIKAIRSYLHLPKVDFYPNLKKDLYIIITSDKGLCGAFNSSLIKFFKEKAALNQEVLIIGKKGYDLISKDRNYIILDDHYLDSNIKYLRDSIVEGKFTKKILTKLAEGYDRLFLVYNSFLSMLKQEVKIKQLFPILVPYSEASGSYAFESNPMEILAHTIPHYLHSLIYQALMNSSRSETAKRMMAMDQASENSKEILAKLKLQYNSERQAKVTKELIEVISGISD
jgi:F-type H+-transporting ATPase subunit gamma